MTNSENMGDGRIGDMVNGVGVLLAGIVGVLVDRS